jgi:phi LC3 family holin
MIKMINWKVRLKNKTWLLSFVLTIVAFIYQILGMVGVAAPISEDMATQIVGLLINLLVGLGVVVDPTTKGTKDSEQALTYNKPQ